MSTRRKKKVICKSFVAVSLVFLVSLAPDYFAPPPSKPGRNLSLFLRRFSFFFFFFLLMELPLISSKQREREREGIDLIKKMFRAILFSISVCLTRFIIPLVKSRASIFLYI